MSQAAGYFTNSGPGGFIQTLTGNSGGAVPPTAGNINVVGTGVITVVGNPGTSTLTITPSGSIASSFITNPATGTATPVAGVLTFAGAGGTTVSAGGSTITITSTSGVTSITGNTGGAQTGAITLVTANSTPIFAGAAGTITLDFNKSNLILGNNGSTITVGAANDGFGAGVLQNITSGSSNSAFGNASLQNVTIGSQTSAFGASAGTAINTGGNNTLIGFQSGLLLQSGNSNVALGYQSGSAWGAAVSNNIAVGSIGAVADSARIRIGTNGTHTTAFIAGIDGVNVGSVAKVVTMASDQLGTATITAGTGISVTPGANTITIATTGATNPVTTLHTQDGNDVTATAGVINISGGSNLTTTGTAGPNTVTISLSGITQHSLQVGGAANALTQLGVASNGQLPIGSTGADPVLATLSAGTGISITNGAGSITISGSGGGLTWSVITADQTAVVNNGYFCNKAGTLALALPAASSVGDVIEVANENTALGVQFTQAAGQQILIGNTNTTLGATGTLTSSAVGDTLKIVCKVANTIWRVTSIVGNWTPA